MKVKHWINKKKNGKRKTENSLGLWNIGVHTRRLKTNGTFTCSVRFSGPPRPTGNTMLRALISRQSGFLLHSNGTRHVGFNILKVYRLGLRNPVNWLLRIGLVAGFPPLLHRADRSISPAPPLFPRSGHPTRVCWGLIYPFPPLSLPNVSRTGVCDRHLYDRCYIVRARGLWRSGRSITCRCQCRYIALQRSQRNVRT